MELSKRDSKPSTKDSSWLVRVKLPLVEPSNRASNYLGRAKPLLADFRVSR